jgi:hypothetical protein
MTATNCHSCTTQPIATAVQHNMHIYNCIWYLRQEMALSNDVDKAPVGQSAPKRTQYWNLLRFLSHSNPFLWQKAAFWIGVTRSGSNIDNASWGEGLTGSWRGPRSIIYVTGTNLTCWQFMALFQLTLKEFRFQRLEFFIKTMLTFTGRKLHLL